MLLPTDDYRNVCMESDCDLVTFMQNGTGSKAGYVPWGGEGRGGGEVENNRVISVNIERWTFYLLQTWLYLVPKINAFLPFVEQLVLTMDLSP